MSRIVHRKPIHAYIAGIARRPLVYGMHDCAVGLVSPIVHIQTGIDLAGPYRGKYTTFKEGARLLKADGYGSLVELVARHFPQRSVASAQFGDVVSIPCEVDGWGLGIVLGERVGVLTEDGFATVPLSTSKMAFTIT